MVFSEGLTNYETWQLAETLDPRIELRWIMPGHPTLKYVSSSLKHVVCQQVSLGCELSQRDPEERDGLEKATELEQRHHTECNTFDTS